MLMAGDTRITDIAVALAYEGLDAD